jgi:hypothetical protein
MSREDFYEYDMEALLRTLATGLNRQWQEPLVRVPVIGSIRMNPTHVQISESLLDNEHFRIDEITAQRIGRDLGFMLRELRSRNKEAYLIMEECLPRIGYKEDDNLARRILSYMSRQDPKEIK